MRDEDKTKEQLLLELRCLRAELARYGAADPSSALFESLNPGGEGEVLYQAIVEDQTELITRFLPDGTLTFVNDAYCRFYGEARKDLLGSTFWHHMPEDDRRKLRAFLDSFHSHETAKTIEHRVIDSSGVVRWLQWTDRAFWDDAGRIAGYQAVGRDITDRKHAEEALRESEARYRRIVDTAIEGIWEVDGNFRTVYVNRVMAEMLGCEPIEMLGRSLTSFVFEDDLPDHETQMAARIEGLHGTYERRLRRKNGDEIWTKVHATALRDPQGCFLGSFAMYTEITGQKRAENLLRASEGNLRALFDAISESVVLFDRDGRVLACNRTFASRLGVRTEDLIGHCIYDHLPPEVARRRKGWLIEVMESGRSMAFEDQRHGLWLFHSLSPIHDSMGRVDRVVAFSVDLTKQKQAELALRESEATYRALVRGLPDIVMRFDRDGRHLFVSENVNLALDFEAAQLIGKTHRELGFPDAECRLWEDAIEGTFRNGAPLETELTMTGKRGETIFDWRLIPEFDALGAVQSVLSVSRNITELRRLEQEYQLLFREMLDGFALHEIICDTSGKPVDYRFVAVNPSFERMTGLRADAVKGRTVLEILPATEPYWIEAYGRVALTGEPISFESFHGELGKHFQVTAYRVAPKQFACVFTDVTQRKMAEEALRKSEEKYRELVEHANSIILRMDSEGRVTFFNEFAERFFGYSEEEILGQHVVGTIVPFTESSGRSLSALIDQIVRSPDSYANHENENMRRDGERVWIAWTNKPVFDEEGRIREILCVGIDVTDRKRAVQALRESEALLAESQKIAHLGSWSLDLRTQRVTWSDEVYRILGLEPQALGPTYGGFLDAVHPEDRETVDAAYSRSLRKGQSSYEIEHRIVRKGTGEVRYVQGKCVHFRDVAGEALRSVGMVQDITERKQAEERLRASEERYRLLAERSLQGIAILRGMPPVFVYINPRWTEIFGYTSDEILSMGPDAIWSLVHPEERSWVRERNRERLKGHIAFPRYEFRIIRKDGTVRWVEVFASLIEAGEDPMSQAVYVDITERKQAEEALRGSEAKYRNLFESAPVGIFCTSSRGQALAVNSAMARMLGLSTPQEALEHYTDLGAQLYACAERRKEFLRLLNEDGRVENFEYEARTADGRRIWLSMNARVDSLGEDGALVIEGFATDITERKRAEEERERLQAQLNQARKMDAVGRLAGGVAHDFNNMLSIILGHAEMLLDEIPLGDPRHDDIMEIKIAGERSADLTRQLLAFARKQTISPRILDLNEAASGILKMLRRLIGENISLAWIPGPNVWPVKMDPSQIDQILANLAVNARDAIGGVGSMSIETANVVLDETYCETHKGFVPGSYVLLAVGDTGSGMDPATLDRIFEPFFTTKEMGKGTGLGLATVYGVVKQNNGFINVYSEPGHGTLFKIYLPRAEARLPENPDSKGKEELTGTETVLLVEDEESILALGKTILERHGYRVLAAQRPGEALRMARSHPGPIHLLLTDVVMPEMNGKDLKEQLDVVKPGFKSIFMSGYTANVIAHHGILDEGIHFLQKPFSVRTLTRKVREVLDG